MCQAIQHGAGEALAAQDLCPLLERQVCCDNHAGVRKVTLLLAIVSEEASYMVSGRRKSINLLLDFCKIASQGHILEKVLRSKSFFSIMGKTLMY